MTVEWSTNASMISRKDPSISIRVRVSGQPCEDAAFFAELAPQTAENKFDSRAWSLSFDPKPAPLPIEPGWYVADYANSPSGKITVELLGTGEWVDNTDSRYLTESWMSELSNLTKLEPAVETAARVIDRLEEMYCTLRYTASVPNLVQILRLQFGVTS